MAGRKKVAIIGAGPSGLVTAKTLLHDFPTGTFAPVIFEQRHDIGGLWPSSPTATTNKNEDGHKFKWNDTTVGPLNPFMRTNISRFTVAFSDLAWESIIEESEVPMFPQAWQVGRYLRKYAERFLPNGVLRLRQRVVRTSRRVENEEGRRWTIQWTTESIDSRDNEDAKPRGKPEHQKINSEEFDFLVVASGYFSSPHIPDIPGLDNFMERTIHSSSLHNAEDVQRLIRNPNRTGGKLVVIGGSMSGAEAASTLAIHVSSSKFTQKPSIQPEKDYEVHHVSTRPFWTIPAYLPREIPGVSPGEKTVSFLPLDLVMYDLARRPPGPIEYAFGPIPLEKAQKTNTYLCSLLGSDYGKFGKVKEYKEETEDTSQPPWVAIGNDYAEYVRSGAVIPTIGRVSTVHRSNGSDLAAIDINLPGGETITLNNVAAIVLATGFTPYNSLSFLPSRVLSLLEYSENDPFSPLVLDGKGTTHTKISDIGFVGFYRGAYWGVMEMQARHLAATWSQDKRDNCEVAMKKKEEERRRIRDLRHMDPQLYRGQFPMGDYVGLMESFARDLGMSRTSLSRSDGDEEGRSGPVLPARYTFANEAPNKGTSDKETTLDALRNILFSKQSQMNTPYAATAVSTAIFRALHGTWKIIRTYNDHTHQSPDKQKQKQTKTTHGTATFHPRYPTSPSHEKEYLYEESEFVSDQFYPGSARTNRSIYRLRAPESTSTANPNTPRILVWSVDTANGLKVALHFLHGISPATTATRVEDREPHLGRFTVHAMGTGGRGTAGETVEDSDEREYVFHFQEVAILSWKCCVTTNEGRYIRTVYERD